MNRNKRMTQCKFAIITAALLGSGSAISGGPPIPLPPSISTTLRASHARFLLESKVQAVISRHYRL